MTRLSKVLWFALLWTVGGGCAHAPPAQTSQQKVPECSGQIPGLEALVQPGRTLLIGEAHGTWEHPAAIAELVCLAARRGVPIRLGVELAVSEQPHRDAFLQLEEDAAAREALLAGDEWKTSPDGRTSEAILSLLGTIRALARAGHPVELFGFNLGSLPNQHRDLRMAEWLRGRLAQPWQGLTVVYVGNYHARVTRFAPPRPPPMGAYLAEAGLELTSLLLRNPTGANWGCYTEDVDQCRAHLLPGRDRGTTAFVELTAVEDGAFHGVIYVPRVSASPPAVGGAPPEKLTLSENDSSVLRYAASEAYKRRDFKQCAAKYSRALANPDGMAEDAYGAACCHALGGEPEAAFARLEEAVRRGYPADDVWRADADLNSLHADPRWERLFPEHPVD